MVNVSGLKTGTLPSSTGAANAEFNAITVGRISGAGVVTFGNPANNAFVQNSGGSLIISGGGGSGVTGGGTILLNTSSGLLLPFGNINYTAVAEGSLNNNSTAVGNVGASGPDDLQTYNLAANGLILAGRGVKITCWGTTANNANAKTVRLMFGGTALVTKQLTPSIAGTWIMSAMVLRTGTSAQKFYAQAENDGGTTVSSTDGATVLRIANASTCTETETAIIVIKSQSTVSTSDNDIVSQGLCVEAF